MRKTVRNEEIQGRCAAGKVDFFLVESRLAAAANGEFEHEKTGVGQLEAFDSGFSFSAFLVTRLSSPAEPRYV